MTDTGDPFLTHSQAARRLHVSVRTIGRLMNDEALSFVRTRTFRRPYASEVDYIAAAISAGRTGSIREFHEEWQASRHQQAVSA